MLYATNDLDLCRTALEYASRVHVNQADGAKVLAQEAQVILDFLRQNCRPEEPQDAS